MEPNEVKYLHNYCSVRWTEKHNLCRGKVLSIFHVSNCVMFQNTCSWCSQDTVRWLITTIIWKKKLSHWPRKNVIFLIQSSDWFYILHTVNNLSLLISVLSFGFLSKHCPWLNTSTQCLSIWQLNATCLYQLESIQWCSNTEIYFCTDSVSSGTLCHDLMGLSINDRHYPTDIVMLKIRTSESLLQDCWIYSAEVIQNIWSNCWKPVLFSVQRLWFAISVND